MEMKLFDSELKVMDVIWREGDITAKRIAEVAKEEIGWSKTTTYTVIKKCIDKGAIERREPKFICHALVTRQEAQEYETNELVKKMYNGDAGELVDSLIKNEMLDENDLARLKETVEKLG